MSKKATPIPAQPSAPITAEVADAVWVGKSDEAKSCGPEKGIGLDSMSAALESHGIKILSKKKVSDGKMRIQMCGADKGDLNGFLIARKDVEKAKGLGFQLVPGNH